MSTIDFMCRGLKKEEVVKLDRLAASKQISREEYVRRIIRKHLLEAELRETENKYENLVRLVADVVQNNSEKMQELIELIKGEEDDEETFYSF